MKDHFRTYYNGTPSFVFGFHGCRKSRVDEVLNNGGELRKSKNEYDWLGPGIYFWEANPQRAFEWACDKYSGQEDGPAVIGACIDLTSCLNLLSSDGLQELQHTYNSYKYFSKMTGWEMPRNKPGAGSVDILYRKLDCAVVSLVHAFRKEIFNKEPYTTVRGVFWEGKPLYPTAGFREKNHIQICVCDEKAILGYFHPKCFDRGFVEAI